MPTDTNPLLEYDTFAELEAAAEQFMTGVNARAHRVTRRIPTEMLAEEADPAASGARRRAHRGDRTGSPGPVNTPMVSFDHGQYSVPQHLLGQQVWVRAHGTGATEQVIVVHLDGRGPVKVARHLKATPGSPRIDDDHFGGPSTKQPVQYVVRPRNQGERDFLAIGDGAHVWLSEAAAAGTQKIRAKMETAVTMAKVAGNARIDWALGHAAVHGRFGHTDLASILNAHPPPPPDRPPRPDRWPKALAAGQESTPPQRPTHRSSR